MISGVEIRRLRKEKKWNQQELAEAVGVTKTTIVDWEKDRYSPTGVNVKKLAAALDISVLHVMDELPSPPSDTTVIVSGTSHSTTDAEVNAAASDEIPVPLYRMAPGDDTPKPIRTMLFRRSVLGDSPAEAYIGIEMRDTSMEPRVPDGSVVVIDTTQTEPRRGGMYYVRFKKDGKCERDAVRFVYPAKDGGLELKSAEGSGIPPDVFTEEGMKNSVEIVGEVILKLTIERV